ncbi:MAG TPA: zinc metalloprotease [Chitinophagaceae bacterium]|nr:zinc metalloprotease [Chitinophagaceae bacterium]
MKSAFWALILMGSGITAFAQRNCATDAYYRTHRSQYAEMPVERDGVEARDTVPNEIIIIPVVVHVLFHNEAQMLSDAQVRSQIDALNRDFRRMNDDAASTPEVFRSRAADTRIMFCLAQVDPAGRPTKGIVRRYTDREYFLGDDGMKFSASGGNDAWDTRKYLNIWVCSMLGRSLGYASFPGGPADKDGVVINYDVFGTIGNLREPFTMGRTATHEVAHWLGLKHIWGDETCGSDDVGDTPRQLSYNYYCPSFPHTTQCSQESSGDMFMNYMDFTNDACMNMFTHGQKKKMRGLFAPGAWRNSFLRSYVCDSSLASGAPIPDDTLVAAKPAGNVKAYPNPVTDFCVLEPDGDYKLEGQILRLYNATGILIRQVVLTSGKYTLPMRGLTPGTYFIKLGEHANKRVIRILKL